MPTTPHGAASTRAPAPWLRDAILALYFALAAGVLAAWWWAGLPRELPDATSDRLQCMSYTPPAGPREKDGTITEAQIAAHLKILATRTGCVRTYSVMHGLDRVPAVAEKLGLKVLLGIWISTSARDNAKEIERAILLAGTYPDVIESIIVGNEVLLRHEQTAATLAPLIERVRRETRVPVTYADVWEFWLRNAALAASVSYITVHILPYWEDQPVAIDQALEHVTGIYDKVRRRFPGRTVFIGETGWPSAGRPRNGAVPSRVNQARFMREFVNHAGAHDIPYNIIEGFDQPWKRALEGTVGGHWGVFDEHGAEKFPLTGPVAEQPGWRTGLLGALAGAILLGGATCFGIRRPTARVACISMFAGAAAGAMACMQWPYLLRSCRDWSEWAAVGAWALSGWIGFGAATVALMRWLDRGSVLHGPAAAHAIVHAAGSGRGMPRNPGDLLGLARFGILMGSAYTSAGLVFASRYRDFPFELMVLPVMALAAFELARHFEPRPRPPCRNAVEELLLASWIGLASVMITLNEGMANHRSLCWNALTLLLAASVLLPFCLGTRKHQRTEQQADPGEIETVEH